MSHDQSYDMSHDHCGKVVHRLCRIGINSIVINRPPEPKIVRLEGWEERELFSDGLDEGF